MSDSISSLLHNYVGNRSLPPTPSTSSGNDAQPELVEGN